MSLILQYFELYLIMLFTCFAIQLKKARFGTALNGRENILIYNGGIIPAMVEKI